MTLAERPKEGGAKLKGLMGDSSLLLLAGSALIVALGSETFEFAVDGLGGHDEPILNWGIAAGLLGPFEVRDWVMVVTALAFVALNVVLWSLPITQTQLFFISLPLGICAFAGFLWYVGR